jgi:hypothetical protein
MRTLTNNLIAKYEKIAVKTKLWDIVDLKKVPGKSIYIMPGGQTFHGKWLSLPTTVIVKWDINIEWDIPANILLIATGRVTFTIPQPSGRANGCESQIIHGIIVAQGWFLPTPNMWYKNDNVRTSRRCRKGNLQVYGVLVGNDLQKVVNSRRSHLEHWFISKQNNATMTDEKIRTERRDEIYKWASVYIEQNPSLWRDMPPGADEFLKTLNVSRN